MEFDYLIYSGGGVRGIAYVGILDGLQRYFASKQDDLYTKVKGSGGTSIGALFGLLTVCGMEQEDLVENTMDPFLATLFNGIDITNLIKDWGLISQESVVEWINLLLYRRFGKRSMTLDHLYRKTHKEFRVCVWNSTLAKKEFWDHTNEPTMLVAQAISTSMALPGIFVPTRHRGYNYQDGGATNNCPVDMFPLERSLVFRFSNVSNGFAPTTVVEYLFQSIYAPMVHFEMATLKTVPEDHQHRVLSLDVGWCNQFNFGLNKCDKFLLFLQGRCAIYEYLGWHGDHLHAMLIAMFLWNTRSSIEKFIEAAKGKRGADPLPITPIDEVVLHKGLELKSTDQPVGST